MYGHFILIGDRLVGDYKPDPRPTSLPEKSRRPARPAPAKPEKR